MPSRYQRAKRYAFWRGATLALLVFTGWIVASGLAGSITS